MPLEAPIPQLRFDTSQRFFRALILLRHTESNRLCIARDSWAMIHSLAVKLEFEPGGELRIRARISWSFRMSLGVAGVGLSGAKEALVATGVSLVPRSNPCHPGSSNYTTYFCANPFTQRRRVGNNTARGKQVGLWLSVAGQQVAGLTSDIRTTRHTFDQDHRFQ